MLHIHIHIYIYIYLFICLFSLYVIHIYIYIIYIYTLWCPCPEWHGRYALAWANPGMPGMPRWHIKQPQQDHFTLHRGTHWQHKGIHVDEAGPENVPTNAELGVRAKDSQWITPGQLRHVEAAGCRLKQVNLSISSIQRQKALLFFCTRCRLIVWDRLIEPGYQHSICLCSYDWVYLCILYIYIYIYFRPLYISIHYGNISIQSATIASHVSGVWGPPWHQGQEKHHKELVDEALPIRRRRRCRCCRRSCRCRVSCWSLWFRLSDTFLELRQWRHASVGVYCI